ncbi:MAG: Gfo/Idh/MocA family oxidoreductase [Myxococcales bacterium]|nr:MAG: Gfo/Idh/MocA family oxidoreductase [Myxococcales bacterium]
MDSIQGSKKTRREFLELSGQAAFVAAAGSVMLSGVACGDSSKKLRIGVVGGNFGLEFPFHLHPNAQVTAVSDLREERLKRLQGLHTKATPYPSLEELLKKEKNIDAVALFTEGPQHAKHVLACFDRGLHVLCAVPACFSLDEAQALTDKQKKTGLTYMMAETSYYRAGCIFAREMYQRKTFGELFYTEAEYYHDRGSLTELVTNKQTRFWDPDGKPSWRQGIPPMFYPTHAIGFLVGVTKERISKVSALGWGNKHPFLEGNRYNNHYWNETALMQTDKGHALRCNIFWLCGAGGERAQWFGENGTLLMANEGCHGPINHPRGGRAQRITMPDYWNSDMLPKP